MFRTSRKAFFCCFVTPWRWLWLLRLCQQKAISGRSNPSHKGFQMGPGSWLLEDCEEIDSNTLLVGLQTDANTLESNMATNLRITKLIRAVNPGTLLLGLYPNISKILGEVSTTYSFRIIMGWKYIRNKWRNWRKDLGWGIWWLSWNSWRAVIWKRKYSFKRTLDFEFTKNYSSLKME